VPTGIGYRTLGGERERERGHPSVVAFGEESTTLAISLHTSPAVLRGSTQTGEVWFGVIVVSEQQVTVK